MADAHSFTWHGTGQNLLESRLRAIDAARSSVCMETFTFRDSTTPDIGSAISFDFRWCFERSELREGANPNLSVFFAADRILRRIWALSQVTIYFPIFGTQQAPGSLTSGACSELRTATAW